MIARNNHDTFAVSFKKLIGERGEKIMRFLVLPLYLRVRILVLDTEDYIAAHDSDVW